ncbi:hypothetical protein INP77_00430 [Methylophilus sp. 13]|uniref:hypothetical protein n=1 Tax=Methylophilus sp. 13 TaxID=2781018 RepID=UPI00188E8412|nr:hypothetical protein [Methylophilus sp. 13]MBF5037947.1 hypothetical protein [Methylophilus sp. 13]
MQTLSKSNFLSNLMTSEDGPTPFEVYFPICIFTNARPWFVCEIIESENYQDNSIVFISNADALKSLQDECSFKSLWCGIPGTLSDSGAIEFHELSEVERSEIELDGRATTIYRLKFKSGKLITYDLSETEFPAEVLLFEPLLSQPPQEKSH